MTCDIDVLIIGAGPAGLSAATACERHGTDYLICETGDALDSRDHEFELSLGSGVGGCGLFSDGKFSFYPSATQLWELENKNRLNESITWLNTLLTSFDVSVPPTPSLSKTAEALRNSTENLFLEKKYPSVYVSLEIRKQLIAFLENNAGNRLCTNTCLTTISLDTSKSRFKCMGYRNGNESAIELNCKRIIFAGGRFGPIGLSSMIDNLPMRFRRLELGVRIEQPPSQFFLRESACLDPKLIFDGSDRRFNWRTFCTCRDGQVVLIECEGIRAVSGRGDDSINGPSNVGLNLRILDEKLGSEIWKEFLDTQRKFKNSLPLKISLRDLPLLDDANDRKEPVLANAVGRLAGSLILQGLRKVIEAFPSISDSDCHIIAPTLEGVGWYPDIDDSLRTRGPLPIWIAGDSTGVFRGLTAAMISGYYTGVAATYEDNT